MRKNKLLISVIITVTLILSVVAIYTAIKLYQLRKESISLIAPKRNAYAFSCEGYDMSIDTNGIVRITNNTSSPQPAKTIDLIVNGQSIGTFDIPQLDPLTNVEMGNINLPEGDFDWSIAGDILCQGDTTGTSHETNRCQSYNFTVNAQVLPTTVPTNVPTQQATNVPTNVPTNTAIVTSTPTSIPTTRTTSQVQPTTAPAQLPDSGVSFPTILSLGIGVFIILGAVLLAF